MMPSSVFLLADLGSRFIEPMNTIDRSMTAVLACRRPTDAPGSMSRLLCRMRVGLSS